VRILHLADLHLDSPLRGLEADPEAPADLIRGATRQALVRAVDFALAQGVALVLIAGDLFDGDWQDWRTGRFMATQLARLSGAGIPVVAIRGNHDAESVLTRSLVLPDGVTMLPADRAVTLDLPELGVAVHGQGFATRAVMDNLALAYPPPRPGRLNIGLLHTAATGREGHGTYAPCTVPQLAAHGYDYWALGHIHTREVLCEDPWIVFPGNLQGRYVNETGAKGGTLLTVRDGRIAEVVHHSFDVVRWARLVVDVDGCADEDAAWARVRGAVVDAVQAAEGRQLSLRLVLKGATPAFAALTGGDAAGTARTQVAAAAAADIWVESVRFDLRPVLDLEQVLARGDATGLLARAILDDVPPGTAELVQAHAATLLGRARNLREALGPDHPVVQAAAGRLPPTLLQQARDLLLARLAGG